MSILNVNKKHHLTESKSFCIVPWIHLYSSPSGEVAPCCIAESCSNSGIGNSRTQSMAELVNLPKMNELRKDMLTGIMNPECKKCHNHEEQNILSSRNYVNKEFEEFYNESIANTNEDGSLKEFKMRYYDIRFSNICNFKCRTCGSGFSTQWEQEDIKSKVAYAKIWPKNDNPKFLEEVIAQVPNFNVVYFAGGEPLITEEHYLLLEEMIRTKKSDTVFLRYNSNLSNFKFKDKDIMSLWKYFKRGIDLYASIDHYGDRAEYIRHGTDWGIIEENLIKARAEPFIKLQINTVLSVFNFLTIGNFYQYLIDKNLYTPKDRSYTLYSMSTPEYYTCNILPKEYKFRGKESLEYGIKLLETRNFKSRAVDQLKSALPWAMLHDTWDKNKDKFKSEIARVDKLRGEDFTQTFPELAPLFDMDETRVV